MRRTEFNLTIELKLNYREKRSSISEKSFSCADTGDRIGDRAMEDTGEAVYAKVTCFGKRKLTVVSISFLFYWTTGCSDFKAVFNRTQAITSNTRDVDIIKKQETKKL